MRGWSRHAPSIQSIATAVTALVAVAALVGVWFQIDANERIQQEQSARDTYRSHLALAVAHPTYAQPLNGCEMITSSEGASYQAFVDHLLYSAEQMLVTAKGWESTFLSDLEPHADYLCATVGPVGDTVETEVLLGQFKLDACPATPVC
jgi:hypothetical protein